MRLMKGPNDNIGGGEPDSATMGSAAAAATDKDFVTLRMIAENPTGFNLRVDAYVQASRRASFAALGVLVCAPAVLGSSPFAVCARLPTLHAAPLVIVGMLSNTQHSCAARSCTRSPTFLKRAPLTASLWTCRTSQSQCVVVVSPTSTVLVSHRARTAVWLVVMAARCCNRAFISVQVSCGPADSAKACLCGNGVFHLLRLRLHRCARVCVAGQHLARPLEPSAQGPGRNGACAWRRRPTVGSLSPHRPKHHWHGGVDRQTVRDVPRRFHFSSVDSVQLLLLASVAATGCCFCFGADLICPSFSIRCLYPTCRPTGCLHALQVHSAIPPSNGWP